VQNRIKEYNNSIAEKKSLVTTLEEKLKELKEAPPESQQAQAQAQQQLQVKKVNRKSNSNLRPRTSQTGPASKEQQKEEITTNTTSTSNTQMNSNHNTNSSKAVTKLSKMLAPSLSNIQSNEMAKKLEQNGEKEKDQSMSMNASCDIRNESIQVNTIFLSTYRFPLNFGNGYLTKIEEGGSTASRRSSKVGKILAIISNHDDRNKDNLVLSDSKILFAKEKNSNTASANKNENNLLEGNSLDMRPHLFEEDKTNSTYLNSVRNHQPHEQPNVRKKLFSTIGTNSGASIGINSHRQDGSTHRSQHTNRGLFTPRIDDDVRMVRGI